MSANLLPFRPLVHWNVSISEAAQISLFCWVGDEFYHSRLATACAEYSPPDRSDASAFGSRLADTLQKRWKKANLIVYGDGKWYFTPAGKNMKAEQSS